MTDKEIQQQIALHRNFISQYEHQADLHRNSVNALQGLLRHSDTADDLNKILDSCEDCLRNAPTGCTWAAEFPEGREKFGTITIGDKVRRAYMSDIVGYATPSDIKCKYKVWIIEE